MIRSPFIQNSVRIMLVLSVALWPTMGITGVPLWAAALGALVASDGVQRTTFILGIVLSITHELVIGFPLGSMLLAWLAVYGLLSLAQHILVIPAWRQSRGWELVGAGVALLVAVGTALLATILSVSTVWLFDGGSLMNQFSHAIDGMSIGAGVVALVIILGMLRWTDEPIHKPILFSTER